MAKRLEIAESLSTRTVNELSDKEKMIKEQSKLIEEKEKEGKKILAATEKLKESKQSQAEMAKKLEETEAASSRAMTRATNKINKKEKIIQEQAKQIEEK